MSRRARLAAWLLLIALALGGVGAACSRGSDLTVAPDFEHTDLDGKPVRLSDLRGRTVVLDFWATWCVPCIFQAPEINRIWRRYHDSGDVVVLGVEIGGASPEDIRSWEAENGVEVEYPILVGADEELARRFGVLGYPATVVVTPDGRIGSVHLGLSSAEELEQAVAKVRSAALAAGS